MPSLEQPSSGSAIIAECTCSHNIIWTPWTDHSSLNFTQGLSLGEADIEHFPELARETEDYL